MFRKGSLAKKLTSSGGYESSICLEDGSKIAVVGGGPAGSFVSYFLLDMARMMGTELVLDVYEPRNFHRPGPASCNHCGGIISESLVQILAADGINLSTSVVQRGIDSYVLHMDVGSVRIETPLQEKRIAAVHRGGWTQGYRGG
jgi:flavin-dependent dehydrogenase